MTSSKSPKPTETGATAAASVADELVRMIVGEMAPGASMPSEAEMAIKHGVSRVTVREAVKMLCSGENGRAFKRRMEDMALYFAETRRTEVAKLSLAVALQVGEGDPGPLDVSFLTGLVQKSFAVLLSQEKAKQEEEPSSLIVKP